VSGLTCSCGDDFEWYYFGPDDYKSLATKRAKRCCSCGSLVRVGELCTSFDRYRGANDDIEQRIHGDEVHLAAWYMCERCSDLYFSLEELGFCINLGSDMRDLVHEYAEMYGRDEP